MKHLFVIYILMAAPAIHTMGQIPGSKLFAYDGIHEVHLTFNQVNFWDSLMWYKEEGDLSDAYTYMVASLDFNGQTIDSIGVRLKGNSSYWSSGIKKSLKLKFNEYVSGQKLDGLKRVNLNNNFNDPTLMREKLFLDILQTNGVNAPRCVYARVFINDAYWGLYTLIDPIDKVFLSSYFYNKSGNLFKGDKDPGMPCANLSYHPEPIVYRSCYTLKTNEELNHWGELENLIYVINKTPQTNYYSTLNSVLNTTSFINAWASNVVFVNVDSYVETGHNYYIYHNPASDKFEWITWDVNEAFGLWNVGMPLEQLYELSIFHTPPNPETERPLTIFMLQDSTFRRLYTDRVYELLCTEFNPDKLFPKIDDLYNLIKADVYADSNKIISNQYFENNIVEDVHLPDYPGWVPGLKSFIQQRHEILMNQLRALDYRFPCTVNTASSVMDDGIFLYPNPSRDCINLKIESHRNEDVSIEIMSACGQFLLSKKLHGSSQKFNITDYPPGIYFMRIIFEDHIKTERIIKL